MSKDYFAPSTLKKIKRVHDTGSDDDRTLAMRPSGGQRVPKNIKKHNRQMYRLKLDRMRRTKPTPYVSGHEKLYS